jgi:hypothetical protein
MASCPSLNIIHPSSRLLIWIPTLSKPFFFIRIIPVHYVRVIAKMQKEKLVYNWYVDSKRLHTLSPDTALLRYAAMVAAGCMVLYGFDAAIFNNVQINKQWLAWFNNPVRLFKISGKNFRIDQPR